MHLMANLGVDFIGGLALRLRAIALEQHWPHPHYNMGVAYLYATCLCFRTAFDYEPIHHDGYEGFDVHPAASAGRRPVTRRSARADRRRLEGIGEAIGTEIVRMVNDREGRRYPIDMWFEASEIVTPSLVSTFLLFSRGMRRTAC